jgi:hypothetical protein
VTDRWKDRLARVDRAVDRVMSESIRITPMLSSDYANPVRDTSRPIIEIEATLFVDRGETDIGGNSRHVRNARVTTSPARLEIMKSKLLPGYDIRKNDAVEAVDKGEHYKIEWIDPRHAGRLVIMLAAVGDL